MNFAYMHRLLSGATRFLATAVLSSVLGVLSPLAMNAQSDGVSRQAIETLKLTYFQLAFLQQTLPTLERNDQLLSQIQQVAESHYRVGQGNQQDVLKAQLQRTKLLQEIAMHHQQEE